MKVGGRAAVQLSIANRVAGIRFYLPAGEVNENDISVRMRPMKSARTEEYVLAAILVVLILVCLVRSLSHII